VEGDRHETPWLGKFNGIAHQIEHDLRDFLFVAPNDSFNLSAFTDQCNFRPFGFVPHHAICFVDNSVERNNFGVKFQPAGIQLRIIQQVVNHTEQMDAALADIACIVVAAVVADGAEYFLDHNFRETDDGTQRCAQLMADICQKFGFRLACLDGSLFGQTQRGFDPFCTSLAVGADDFIFLIVFAA